MKHSSLRILVLMFCFPVVAFAEGSAECTQYWTKVRELNDRYEERHDLKNANELWKLLPTGKKLSPEGCPKRDETIEALSRDSVYRIKRVQFGDVAAVQLSFRLMSVADGAFAEELDIDLGKLILKNPRIFLKYLQAEHGDAFCSDGLLGNTGEYDQEPEKDRSEMRKRARALESVKDRKFRKLRDLCISRLKKLKNPS